MWGSLDFKRPPDSGFVMFREDLSLLKQPSQSARGHMACAQSSRRSLHSPGTMALQLLHKVLLRSKFVSGFPILCRRALISSQPSSEQAYFITALERAARV